MPRYCIRTRNLPEKFGLIGVWEYDLLARHQKRKRYSFLTFELTYKSQRFTGYATLLSGQCRSFFARQMSHTQLRLVIRFSGSHFSFTGSFQYEFRYFKEKIDPLRTNCDFCLEKGQTSQQFSKHSNFPSASLI